MLLEVALLKVWPPEHQVFLLFALLWVIKRMFLCNVSYVQLLSDKEDCPLLSFPALSCFPLKEMKVSKMYYIYLI